MPDSLSLNELESGGNAASFPNIGDQYAGTVVDINKRSQTDPVTGSVKTFNDGTPRPIIVIDIETDSGERVSLWAKGGTYVAAQGEGLSMADAIGAALRAAGADSLTVGGKLAVRHTGLSDNKPGMNPAKLYVAQYQPPAPKVASAPADLFSS